MRGGVFICYRRDDTAGFAGRIYDRLKSSLGRESVFIDVDNIPAGRDFVEVLSERVGRCDALVALIGRNWLISADKDNRRRLDDPNDFVRIEIEAALERNVPVIPVLVDGAVMPQANDLPDTLKKLARRQGIEISHNRFDSDAERLTEALAGIDGDMLEQSPASPDAGAALPMATMKPAASARRLLLTVAALIVIVGGAGFLYIQRQAQPQIAASIETPQAPIPTVTPAPTTSDDGPNAAAPPLDNAPNAAAAHPENALDQAPTGKIADSPPSKLGKTSTPDANAASQQWMNIQDFSVDYQRQIDWNYPDKAWGRCQNGVSQRGAHWSPRPAGQYFLLHGTNDRTFRKDSADLTAKGFKMQYDNVFQECDGSMHHQTLWMKEG